jgi:hypothetical protein
MGGASVISTLTQCAILYSSHLYVLRIEDMYADCYLHRHGVALDRGIVLSVLKALQSHPETGALWEKRIVRVSVNHLGFTVMLHECNVYHGTFMGDRVYKKKSECYFNMLPQKYAAAS